ncbi:hypothetical protein [Ralstonia pseudosolanacearum]|nr:hypothetical protein [Ralstonia pseudosolanacearum]
MRAPKFKHFAPKVDALKEAPLRMVFRTHSVELSHRSEADA